MLRTEPNDVSSVVATGEQLCDCIVEAAALLELVLRDPRQSHLQDAVHVALTAFGKMAGQLAEVGA